MEVRLKTIEARRRAEQIEQWGKEGRTAKEMGALLGISAQRVFQIQRKFNIPTSKVQRKSHLRGLPPKYHWLDKMLRIKQIPPEDRKRIIAEWEIPDHCPILGIPLNYEGRRDGSVEGFGRSDDSPSIDQIIPGAGYFLGNIQILSWRANRIKSNATPDELRAIANYMCCIQRETEKRLLELNGE
jgi:hypothetical protein